MLKKEISHYEEYIVLVRQEKEFITRFNAEKLAEITKLRADIYEKMLQAQDQRMALMREFPIKGSHKLRGLIKECCLKADQQKLMPLAEKLYKLVETAQSESKEQRLIINFGLRLVHGVVSLFWSATNNVVKSYGRTGISRESTNPTTRDANLLKRA